MRTPNLGSVSYAPADPPQDAAEMQRFLREELLKIQAAIQALAVGHLDKTYVAPTKPRDGDVRYADGTSWNPGAGAGMYFYNGSTWVPMAGSYYGSMYDNGTTQAVVIASAGTWTAVDGGMTGGSSNAFTFQNSRELVCNIAGKYLATWTLGAMSAAGGDDIEASLMINGTAQANVTSKTYEGTASKEYLLAGTGILTLAANDIVKFALRNLTNGDDQTVDHANVTLLYVGP